MKEEQKPLTAEIEEILNLLILHTHSYNADEAMKDIKVVMEEACRLSKIEALEESIKVLKVGHDIYDIPKNREFCKGIKESILVLTKQIDNLKK